MPVAVRSKVWVCGRSLAGTVGSSPAGGHGSPFLASVVCSQEEVSATLPEDSYRVCVCVSECDLETSTMRRPWPTRTVEPWGEKVSSDKTKRSVSLKPCIYTLLDVSGHFVPSLKVILMTASTSATSRFLAHFKCTVKQAIL
jgi:hypothetical protein